MRNKIISTTLLMLILISIVFAGCEDNTSTIETTTMTTGSSLAITSTLSATNAENLSFSQKIFLETLEAEYPAPKERTPLVFPTLEGIADISTVQNLAQRYKDDPIQIQPFALNYLYTKFPFNDFFIIPDGGGAERTSSAKENDSEKGRLISKGTFDFYVVRRDSNPSETIELWHVAANFWSTKGWLLDDAFIKQWETETLREYLKMNPFSSGSFALPMNWEEIYFNYEKRIAAEKEEFGFYEFNQNLENMKKNSWVYYWEPPD
jgi:hypothetical protein